MKISHSQILCLYDSKNIFEFLADAAGKIEWLSIFGPVRYNQVRFFLSSIWRLKHLKILELCLTRYNVDILREVVENLPNLNELRLERNGLKIAEIKKLAKCDTLTVLSFHNYHHEPLDPIDDAQFDEILRSVSKRTSGMKLQSQIQSRKINFLKVAQKKINSNLNILEIQIRSIVEHYPEWFIPNFSDIFRTNQWFKQLCLFQHQI